MFCNTEAVANAFRSEKNHVVEIRVSVAAVIVRLASMKDEREIDAQVVNLLAHGEKFGYPVLVRKADVFLAVHIESLRKVLADYF
jgi:hypothetical protein